MCTFWRYAATGLAVFSAKNNGFPARPDKGTTVANPVFSESWLRINPQTDVNSEETFNDEAHTEVFNLRCGAVSRSACRLQRLPNGETGIPAIAAIDDMTNEPCAIQFTGSIAWQKISNSDMDRALDRSRTNGTDREDRINEQVHQFRDAVGDLKSRVGNGRDLNRSADEARRVFQEAQQIDRVGRRLDSRTASHWNAIQRELEFLGDVYGFRYNGGYGRDDDYRRRDDDYRSPRR